MFLILNESTSPDFNLALEEYALCDMGREAVILWRNEASVIVGRNQNAYEEIDVDYVRERGIKVIRRQSGGGAVFHDLGNVNYTIIRDMESGDFNNYELFTRPILGYLASFGIPAELQGRNDLVIKGAKFCGNAQAAQKGRIMHHGCILYSADFSRLVGALKPRDIKFESRGVKSVRKRVTNIADHMEHPMPVEEFMSGLADYFMKNTAGMTPRSLTPEDLDAVRVLARNKYSSWEWNFGASPPYDMKRARRYDFGIVDVRLSVEGGLISEARIYGDFFGTLDKAEVEAALKGSRHDSAGVRDALSSMDVGKYITGMTRDDLVALIC
jgi:lipoate-protein ligase A